MIQQQKLLEKLHNYIPNNLLIVGERYSGKKTLVSEITSDSYETFESCNIDLLRDLPKGLNYVFCDIDDWNYMCFPVLLKRLEENDDHIILTARNLMNVPESIQSRCIIEMMEPYIGINKYCDNIGQIAYYSDEMLKYIDKFIYDEKFDFDVYFTVLCNRLLERIKNGEHLEKELLICCKYNRLKSLKSVNKKQFIINWTLDLQGLSEEWKRI